MNRHPILWGTVIGFVAWAILVEKKSALASWFTGSSVPNTPAPVVTDPTATQPY